MTDKEFKQKLESMKSIKEYLNFVYGTLNVKELINSFDILSDSENNFISEKELEELISKDKIRIKCKILKNDWNCSHLAIINNKYYEYLLNA